MQTCFFAISGVLPRDLAIARIKAAIQKSYGAKGEDVVRKNWEAVDQTLAQLHQVPVPRDDGATSHRRRLPIVSDQAPAFVREVRPAGSSERVWAQCRSSYACCVRKRRCSHERPRSR
jgi:pyruvate-ferredoxin/flavodoxin oxidoreductase